MFSRNGFSLTFLLGSVCVLLVVMTPPTKAECDCDKPENEQRTGWDKWMYKAICGVKGAARTVSNKVKDGYHYVKDKLSSSDSKPPQGDEYYDIDLRSGFGDNTEKPVQLAN